jgi:hypothetical protein
LLNSPSCISVPSLAEVQPPHVDPRNETKSHGLDRMTGTQAQQGREGEEGVG